MSKLKKGLVIGGILGGALAWLNFTTKGKEYRAKLFNHLEPLFGEIKLSLKKLEGPTREMYEALVERAVEEYATRKELAIDMKNNLIRELKKKWKEIEKN